MTWHKDLLPCSQSFHTAVLIWPPTSTLYVLNIWLLTSDVWDEVIFPCSSSDCHDIKNKFLNAYACMCVWESPWPIYSCLLPWWCKRPLHPLSHVPDHKVVSKSATLRADRVKTTQVTWKHGKGQQAQSFSYVADCDGAETERECEKRVPWLGFTSMICALLAAGVAKDRLQIHTHTHIDAFFPLAHRIRYPAAAALSFFGGC